MTNYPDDFVDSSIKFRNISLSQNEKEMVSNTSPIAKLILIDYFIEAVKKLNLKNPIVVSGDAPTYSTFSYTATEGDKVTPKFTRGVSVIATDWSVQLKSLGDVLDSDVYDYAGQLREAGQAPRVLERTTYGWVEQTNIELTFWAINSSKGRDLGGQFIKRTMLEGQKSLHFIKNGIMAVVPSSGFDSNDTGLLKTNGSILYQHVTRWVLTTFFYINTTKYEAEELMTGINIDMSSSSIEPFNIEINNKIVPQNSNSVVYTDNGAIVYNDSLQEVVMNQNETLNAYAAITLSDRNQPDMSLTTTTTVPGVAPYVAQNYPTLNNYYLSDDGFENLTEQDLQNNLSAIFESSNSPNASNIETTHQPLTITTTTTTTSSTTTTTTV